MAEAEKSTELLGLSKASSSSDALSPSASGSSHLFSEVSFKKMLHWTIDLFTPEILGKRKGPIRRPGPTAWLDGLRGVAAFCVVIMHLLTYTHDGVELCYGAMYFFGVYNLSPLSLPFLRVFFIGGHFAVMLFFVISGYVLPGRLIRMLHESRQQDFIESLNSSIVRRPFRLFLPVLWSTLAFAMIWHIFNIETPWPAHQANIFYEFMNWVMESARFIYFFRRDMLFTTYNIHTWTIPVELQGSCCIFFWLLATHQVSTRGRVLLTLGITLYLVIGAAGAWYGGFFAGMLTLELDMLAAEGSVMHVKLPWDPIRKWLNNNQAIRQAILHGMLLFAMFLGGMPSGENMKIMDVLGKCPGWKTLGYMIPPAYDDGKTSYRWFWLFWGAWMMLVAVKEISWARWCFETGPAQYLGRHSFSLYLIHGPMIGMLSERLFYAAGVKHPVDMGTYMRFAGITNMWSDQPWWPFSSEPLFGAYGLEPNFLFCAFLSMIVFLYTAEIGTKLFDLPSVTVSKWVYVKMKSLR